MTSDLTVYAKFTATSTVDPDPKPEPPVLTYEWQTTVDATCTTAGIEERINPDTNQKESREIIPLGHVYGEFVTTRDPSCTVEGSKSKTCFRCRDVVTESIPVVDHVYGDWVITEQPTCSTMGKQVKQCQFCQKELDSELITADHSFGADDTCVHCGCSNLLYYIDYHKNYSVRGFANPDIEHTSLVIPKYYNGKVVDEIGSGAFSEESNLISVTIPDTVTSIGEYAFGGCHNLANVNYLGTIESWCNIQGLNYLMQYGTSGKALSINGVPVTELVIPSTVTSIPSYAFAKTSITSVTIPDSVTSIGEYAFRDCSLLIIYCEAESKPEGWNSSWSYSSCIVWNCNSNDKDENEYAYAVIDGIRYGLKDNVATVIRQPDNITEANIPQTVTYKGADYVVTNIEDFAFYNCSSLTSITIPDSVTSIGKSAFKDCKKLENITVPFVGASKSASRYTHFGYIFGAESGSGFNSSMGRFENNGNNDYVPSSLKTVVITGGYEIADDAFYGCSNITSITIPDSVTSIGKKAFYDCYKLVNINYLGTIDTWCEIEGLSNLTIDASNIKTLSLNGDPVTELVIPSTVTSIPSYAFYKCDNITSVTFEENSQCTSVGYGAFCNCSSLTSVNIGDGVTSIGYSAFSGCSSLLSITISNSITSIGGGDNYYLAAFYDCSKLANINYLGTVDAWCKIEGLNYLMPQGSNGKTLTIDGKEISGELVMPSNLTSIASCAFYKTNVASVTFEENSQCTSIGGSAFSGCSSLISITIPDSVTSIGLSAFYNCNSLASITIPDGVTIIDTNMLYGCNSLKSVTIGENVKSIGDYAFWGCSSLLNITIPNSVKTIGYATFYDCSSLTSVIIGENVRSIGQSAFGGCSSLPSITIPNSVKKIDYNAFYGCDLLADINYLGTVDAWCKIEGLWNLMTHGSSSKSLTIDGKKISGELIIPYVTSIASGAFYNCKDITSITFTGGNSQYTNIGASVFYGCSSLTSVTIAISVTSIGHSVFDGCSNLQTVYYKGESLNWSYITIYDNNSYLIDAARYYYSETEPALNNDGTAYDGNYWHYDENGEIVIWTKE